MIHQLSTKALFFQHLAQTTLAPIALEIQRAEGIFLYDNQNKPYYDLISGISVSSVGHQNPTVKQAIIEQVNRNMHVMVYGEVIHDTTVQFSQFIVNQLPEELNSVYFVNSGSEATDAAMKLAKRATGKAGFVAQRQAYHGSSQGPLSLMDDPYFSGKYRPLLNQVFYISQNNLEEIEHLPLNGVAAVVLELIQSERGAQIANQDYIDSIVRYCQISGALLIIDEIQTGLYRTGIPFEFMRYNIVPDILLLGKSLGGGMPMGALVASQKLMHQFAENPILGHITTFGGHPVVAAAGLAANKWVFSNIVQLQISEKSNRFKEKLKHPLILEVTGRGLLLACHIDPQIQIIEFNQKLLQRGVFTDWFLFNMNAIRIAPPFIINENEIDIVCALILQTLDEYSS
jgi:acetylornithine/succinyldiaminopimelate/putrescine aminotransferase